MFKILVTKDQLATPKWAWLEFICDYNTDVDMDFFPKMLSNAVLETDSVKIGGDSKNNVIVTGNNNVVG